MDGLDSLDLSLNEIDALQAIYAEVDGGEENKEQCVQLVITSSTEELDTARSLVDTGCPTDQIPTLALEVQLQVKSINGDDGDTVGDSGFPTASARLYFGLVPGYPSHKAVSVTILTAKGMSKTEQEDLTQQLQARSRDAIGAEAIMELIQACQDEVTNLLLTYAMRARAEKEIKAAQSTDNAKLANSLSRRWIWVHHITDRQRKEDIVREAQEHHLGGYLKAGYPGIIVVEGKAQACNEFVSWIKGNKSRPGGFGRQWGHHVRGELEIERLQLPDALFVALKEELSALALISRKHGLDDEFKLFVMQHG